MKNYLKLGLLIFFMSLSPLLKAQESGAQFTLNQCIDYALEHNQELLNKELDKKIARHKKQETIAIGLPQINAEAKLDRNYEIRKMAFNGGVFPAGTEYTGDFVGSVKQLIFDGSFFVGLEAASTYLDLSRKDRIKTAIDVVESVNKAFYLVLVRKANQEYLDKSHKRLAELHSETQKMYEAGFAERLDVDRIKVNLNNVKLAKEQNVKETALAKLLLKFQMGMSIDYPIFLEGELKENGFAQTLLQTADDYNFKDRIEYSILETNIDLAMLEKKNNNVKYIPTLYLNANYGWNNPADNFADVFKFGKKTVLTTDTEGNLIPQQINHYNSFGTIGLTMSIPIFDGLKKHHVNQQLKLKLGQLENQKSMLVNNIGVEVKQAETNLWNNIQALEIQKENSSLAERVYNDTQIKYKEGVGANLDVIEADKSFQEAKTNYYQALYQVYVSKVALEKATGKLKY